MLTIPESIKTLFKTDGVYKNFRASFPGGEAADITNANIVRESVKFTESVCSDDTMRFGGCERSVVEFETVGVENILGLTIECGIEIDTTSLTAAQLAAVQSDPGDGILVLAADSDIGRGYYRVPLGVFRVVSCPRNHENTAHRQITAYSPRSWNNNPFEQAKLDWMTSANKITMDSELRTLALLGNSAPEIMTADGWTKSRVYTWRSSPAVTRMHSRSVNTSVSLKTADGETVTVAISGTVNSLWLAQVPGGTLSPPLISSGIGAIVMLGFPAADAVDFFRQQLEVDREIDYDASALTMGPAPVSTFGDLLRWKLRDACAHIETYDLPERMQAAIIEGDVPVLYTATPALNFALYPGSVPNTYPILTLDVPESVTVTITQSGHATVTRTFSTPSNTGPEVWMWSKAGRTPLPQTINASCEAAWSSGGTAYTSRNWFGAADASEQIKGWEELHGAFLASGRGQPKTVRLDPDHPAEEIGPGEYASCWWSEYDPQPVGQVAYTFAGSKSGIWGSLGYGSVYEMSGNAILTKATSLSAAQVNSYISRYMRSGLQALGRYVPAELTMPAWPWLEAGDTVKVTAEDGTVVLVGIFRRTMTGVQMLMDSIEAPGGELEADDEF